MTQSKFDLFVGSYGEASEETIHWLIFDEETAEITEKIALKGITNPSFLTLDQTNRYLYAVSEIEAGQVVAYKMDQDTIKELNRQETKGAPCFVEQSHHHLFTANFGNGSVIVHPVSEDGSLHKYIDYHAYLENVEGASHIHAIRQIPQTDYYLATDLGHNELILYSFSEIEGKLSEEMRQALPKGAGPRHIAFHPNDKLFYVVNEHDSTICIFSYDLSEGEIIQKQVISTIPDDFTGTSHGAHIVITANGRYVYASNRGHHSIALFAVLDNGSLQLIDIYKLQGEWPRHFALSPKEGYLLVVNEHSHTIELFEINENGTLVAMEKEYKINKPVCLSFENADMTAFSQK